MSSIQDIHAFEEKIYDIVQDYIDENYDFPALTLKLGSEHCRGLGTERFVRKKYVRIEISL